MNVPFFFFSKPKNQFIKKFLTIFYICYLFLKLFYKITLTKSLGGDKKNDKHFRRKSKNCKAT